MQLFLKDSAVGEATGHSSALVSAEVDPLIAGKGKSGFAVRKRYLLIE